MTITSLPLQFGHHLEWCQQAKRLHFGGKSCHIAHLFGFGSETGANEWVPTSRFAHSSFWSLTPASKLALPLLVSKLLSFLAPVKPRNPTRVLGLMKPLK